MLNENLSLNSKEETSTECLFDNDSFDASLSENNVNDDELKAFLLQLKEENEKVMQLYDIKIERFEKK